VLIGNREGIWSEKTWCWFVAGGIKIKPKMETFGKALASLGPPGKWLLKWRDGERTLSLYY